MGYRKGEDYSFGVGGGGGRTWGSCERCIIHEGIYEMEEGNACREWGGEHLSYSKL